MRDYYRGNGKMESGGELYPPTLEQMIKVADALDSHVMQLQKESSDTFREYMKVKAQLDARQLYPWSESLPVQLPPSRTRRIYIAGPMSGIEDHNFPAFNAQAEILRKEGWTVLNPADHGVVEGAEWGDYLRHDLAGLVTCEAIYLLPGWEGSKGARLEVVVAEQLGLTILSAEPYETLAGSSNIVAWHYVDSWGSHVTEDFNEIQDSCGIEEWTALTPVRRYP